MIDDAGTIAPIEESPDAVRAIVRGGGGKHPSGQPAFGRQARPVTRLIGRPRRRVVNLSEPTDPPTASRRSV